MWTFVPASLGRAPHSSRRKFVAKFIRVEKPEGYAETAAEETSYYVNVDMIRYIAQDPQNPDRSSIRLVGDEHAIHINESAASFVSRAEGD